ncbi:MAG: hypothetical protein ACREBI_07110 [Nitrosotalea sp.]
MQLKLMIIIPIIAVLIPVAVFVIISANPFMSVEHENLFMPTDQEKLVQLALSDPRVKQAIGDRPYHAVFEYGSVVPNTSPPFTDSTIKFLFDDDSYVSVKENLYQNKVIDVQSGTNFKST